MKQTFTNLLRIHCDAVQKKTATKLAMSEMAELQEFSGLLCLDNSSAQLEALEPEQETQHRSWRGSVKGILAAFIFVFSHIVSVTNVQLLQRRIPDIELNVFRCIGILIFCVIWMLFRQKLPTILWSDIPVMLLYAFFVTLDSVSFYIGVAVIPAAFGQSVQNSVSLISILLLFQIFGLEKLTFPKLFSVILCATGVILVLQPWYKSNANKVSGAFEFERHNSNCTNLIEALCHCSESFKNISLVCGLHMNKETISRCQAVHSDFVESNITCESFTLCEKIRSCWFLTHGQTQMKTGNIRESLTEAWLLPVTSHQKNKKIIGIFFIGLAGFAFAALSLLLKMYHCLSEDRCRSLFWSFTLSLIVSIILSILLESPVWPQGIFDSIVVSLHCLASLSTWTFTIYSLQYISGSTCSVIYSTTVVFSLIPQYTILSSILPGHKNWMEVVGVVVVLSGSCLASLLEIYQNS